MRILALDAALGGWAAGLIESGRVLAEAAGPDSDGLAVGVETLLQDAGSSFGAVAVTIGPGSFTGIRAALALAHGIALARAVPIHGVTVGAALAAVSASSRPLWAAIDSRRARIFLECDGAVQSVAADGLPTPATPIAVAGDAAVAVAARLAARGADVQLLAARRPTPLGVALAALHAPGRPAQPLYIDPPAARPGPAGRPAPV